MKQEGKELLLKDLCGRLPYRVKCRIETITGEYIAPLNNINRISVTIGDICREIAYVKPYLFPMSSMTQKQQEEYGEYYDKDLASSAKNLHDRLDGIDVVDGYPMYNHIDWLNANHFDYRGLIEKSLALDATNLNIY